MSVRGKIGERILQEVVKRIRSGKGMKIWVVSNECSGLSEAGGVKDVTYSLCENFSQKNDVTLFIPLYGCTNLSCIKFLPEKELANSRVHKKTALFREEIRPNLVCSTPITARRSLR